MWHIGNGTTFCPTLEDVFMLNLYSVDILGSFEWPLFPLRWRSGIYFVKLPDVLDLQSQVTFYHFLCLSIGKVMGEEGNCCICSAVLFTVEVYHHHHHLPKTVVCFAYIWPRILQQNSVLHTNSARKRHSVFYFLVFGW